MSGAAVYFSGKWRSETFSSSGTFNVPDEVNRVWVEMYGGGGGGEVVSASDSAFGGEAGERIGMLITVTPLAAVSVTIGTGGAGSTGFLDASSGTATSFGGFKSRGGRGATVYDDGTGQILNFDKGQGVGLDSFRATGGTTLTPGLTLFGGDAGFGSGGSANTGGNGGAGGTGAGGGSSSSAFNGGAGGAGICIVHYKID